MNFTIDRKTFLATLTHVQSVVERKNTMPILANIKMEATADTLKLTATDMEIAIVETVPLTLARPGITTVPAATLFDMVKRLPDAAEIAFSLEGGTLTVKAGRFKTDLMVLPAEDFPEMMSGEMPHRFSLPAKALLGLISKTAFAMSTEETRYYLNGIHFHVPDGATVMRAVATDGHRLARLETPLPDGAESMPPIILPRKAVHEVQRLLAGSEAAVEVCLSDTKAQFTLGQVQVTTRLIEGTFPDYERVIPKGNDRVLRIGKAELVGATGRVGAISGEKARPVKLALAGSVLTLSGDGDKGRAEESIEDIKYDGPAMEIGFQARYLTDIADQCEDMVEMRFGDSQGPVLVSDPGDEAAVYVLMPMRV